ncbi:2-phospho-L-lactate guanylyltransferase [Natronosalvus caseinilyticus]|uniref:2-phospho-L-lactate guanylyltransferase n=1 Tax=Natronosalvus caseinilyticus TaxID=2953747 RepID=UPI0028AB4542|nr:2-phospho-L-lactate guanylyltransferase [Natronosalvus caseinilyticus]
MQVVVPFAEESPKSRLAPVLEREERRRLARAMLADVCSALRAVGREPTILATEPLSASTLNALEDPDVNVIVDDRALTPAVNAVLESVDDTVAIVMADLALATPAALETLFETPGEVVVAPGRGGGTNALVVRHPAFRTDYHGASILDHRRQAREIEASLETVDSFRLATDVDEPADLVEGWLHGGDHTRAALEAFGFDLETTEGRVRLVR